METILPGLAHARHVHPMFVHYPIVLWSLAWLMMSIGALRGSEQAATFGRWSLYLGTISAVVASITGLLASNELGHDSPGHDIVHDHRNWMLAASGLALVTCGVVFALRRRASARARWTSAALLAALFIVMTLGSDRGAYLVFAEGVGVQPASP